MNRMAAAVRPYTHMRPSLGISIPSSLFHTVCARNNQSDEGQTRASFERLDVLGDVPVPSTAVDACLPAGFKLNNSLRTSDGSGVLLVGGEAFRWRPWLASESKSKRLLNAKGQWHVDSSSLGLLGSVWPRPDILVLGLGPGIRPISPELRGAISEMGMRLEILDTRNAAAQYNLLATERGVQDVAAALIPIGWREGRGAGYNDKTELTLG